MDCLPGKPDCHTVMIMEVIMIMEMIMLLVLPELFSNLSFIS